MNKSVGQILASVDAARKPAAKPAAKPALRPPATSLAEKLKATAIPTVVREQTRQRIVASWEDAWQTHKASIARAVGGKVSLDDQELIKLANETFVAPAGTVAR